MDHTMIPREAANHLAIPLATLYRLVHTGALRAAASSWCVSLVVTPLRRRGRVTGLLQKSP